MVDILNSSISDKLFGIISKVYAKIGNFTPEKQEQQFKESPNFSELKPHFEKFVKENPLSSESQQKITLNDAYTRWIKVLEESKETQC